MPQPGPASLPLVVLFAVLAAPATAGELADPSAVRSFCDLADPAPPVVSVSTVADPGSEAVLEGSGAAVDGVLVHGDAAWADGVAARDRAHARARVLLQAHVVDVVASSFAFDPWDEALGVLSVDVTDGIPLHGGAWSLGLEGTDRVAFAVDEETAEDLVALRRMGSLSMRVVFEVATAADPDASWCLEGDDGSVTIAARLVSAEIVEPLTDRVRARATTDRFDAGRVRYGVEPCGTVDVAEPVAEVARVRVSSEDGVAGEIAPLVQLYLEAHLSDCYVRHLAANARLQGAMTLGFRIDDAGHSADAEVLIDAVDSPDLTRCVMTAIDGLDLPGDGAAASDVQLTVTFDPDGADATTSP